MNALSILRHAYMTISNAHPEKDAFAVVADVEALVRRLVEAASTLESKVTGKAETSAAPQPATVPAVTAPVAPSSEPDTLYPLPPLPAA